jgi:hypothetical protein
VGRHTIVSSLIAGFALASGAVRAQAPQYLYDTYTDAYGEATAVATTTPSLTYWLISRRPNGNERRCKSSSPPPLPL